MNLSVLPLKTLRLTGFQLKKNYCVCMQIEFSFPTSSKCWTPRRDSKQVIGGKVLICFLYWWSLVQISQFAQNSSEGQSLASLTLSKEVSLVRNLERPFQISRILEPVYLIYFDFRVCRKHLDLDFQLLLVSDKLNDHFLNKPLFYLK